MYGYIHDIPPQQIPHSFFIAIKPNDNENFLKTAVMLFHVLQKEMHKQMLHISRRSLAIRHFTTLHFHSFVVECSKVKFRQQYGLQYHNVHCFVKFGEPI